MTGSDGSTVGEDRHEKVTLFERENGEPVVKLGEHDDMVRVTDDGFEEMESIEIVDLQRAWSTDQLVNAEPHELPDRVQDHLQTDQEVA